MKPGFRTALVLAVLALLAALPPAIAQETGPLGPLERYELALENLDAAVEALPADPARAREELLRAEGALRVVADGGGGALIADLERLVDRAEVAVENRSRTDLAVQAAVLEGGLRRLLLDGALRAADAGDLDAARVRVARLAEDVGAPQGAAAAIAAAPSAAELRAAYAEAVAVAAAERVRRAPEVYAASGVDDAYLLLASAYGDLVSIRGADGADAGVVAAIAALVERDEATLAQEAAAAAGALEAYAADVPAEPSPVAVAADPVAADPVAADPVAADPVAADPTMGAETVPADPVAADPVATDPVATDPVATDPVAADPVAADPAATDPTVGAETVPADPAPALDADPAPASTGAPAGTATGAGVAPLPGPRETRAGGHQAVENPAVGSDALVAELRGYGLSAPRATSLADTLTANGFPALDRVFDALYVAGARALVAVEVGDPASARVGIAEFGDVWRTYLRPVAEASAPATAAETDRLLDRLSAASALRLQDLAVLLGHVDVLRDALRGAPAPAVHAAIVDATVLWAGLPRLIVLILLGVLAIVPLVLLNLAFGGGNRNWQLIGVALFLLLLPVIFEGLGYALALLGGLAGIPALGVLSSWSIFQNTISQIAWAVVTAAAIGFAIAGLYGICVQFGLLGRRAPDVRQTQPGTRATATASATADDTLVDWDEEF